MKIEYKISKSGIGLFLFGEITQLDNPAMDAIIFQNGLSISISELIKKYYADGLKFLILAFEQYGNIRHSNGNPIHLRLESIESNPAHYQDEMFYGFAISVLNVLISETLPLPVFNIDQQNKCFRFEIPTS